MNETKPVEGITRIVRILFVDDINFLDAGIINPFSEKQIVEAGIVEIIRANIESGNSIAALTIYSIFHS